MAPFNSIEDLTGFLEELGPQYCDYAPALWKDGKGLLSHQDLACADVEALELLGVCERAHALRIIKGEADVVCGWLFQGDFGAQQLSR